MPFFLPFKGTLQRQLKLPNLDNPSLHFCTRVKRVVFSTNRSPRGSLVFNFLEKILFTPDRNQNRVREAQIHIFRTQQLFTTAVRPWRVCLYVSGMRVARVQAQDNVRDSDQTAPHQTVPGKRLPQGRQRECGARSAPSLPVSLPFGIDG